VSNEFDKSQLDELEFDNGGSSQRSISGRDRIDRSGFYHLYVSSISGQNDSTGKLTGVKLSLIALGGDWGSTDPKQNQVGAKLDHFVNFTKKDGSAVSDLTKQQNARLVRSLQLATEEEVLAGKYKAKWSAVEGRQFYAKIVVKPDNNGQDRAQIDFGQTWMPGDEAARKIPAHIDSLQSAGYSVEGQKSFVAVQAEGSSETPDNSNDDNVPF
jgi:hypothetical protein